MLKKRKEYEENKNELNDKRRKNIVQKRGKNNTKKYKQLITTTLYRNNLDKLIIVQKYVNTKFIDN